MPFTLNDVTQTSPEIHVGDVGTKFVVTIYDPNNNLINLASATSMTIRFQKPNGETEDKTAILFTNGIDGKMMYVLEDGDIDIAGAWQYQGIVGFLGGTWHTNIVPFRVYANIATPVP